MKFTLLIFIVIFITSCIPIDKEPGTTIHIDDKIISEIDSIFILDSSNAYNYCEKLKVNKDENEFFVTFSGNQIKIKIKFKNNKELITDPLDNFDRFDKIGISIVNGKIEYKYFPESKPHYNSFLTILFIFFVIFCTKILSAVLIMWPRNKFKFILYFGILNVLYFLFVILMFYLYFPEISIKYLFWFYLLVIVIDIFYLIRINEKQKNTRPIIAGIVSNVIFMTIGHLIITIAMILVQ